MESLTNFGTFSHLPQGRGTECGLSKLIRSLTVTNRFDFSFVL